MARRRLCRICRKWFRPDPRVGDRQHVCGKPECQKEGHKQACRLWRMKNRHYDRQDRLVVRLVRDEPAGAFSADPLRAIDWNVARDEIGLEVAVLVEESGKVFCRWARDEIAAQLAVFKGKSAKVSAASLRDEMATGPRPP